jgi:hypothetical protein
MIDLIAERRVRIEKEPDTPKAPEKACPVPGT